MRFCLLVFVLKLLWNLFCHTNIFCNAVDVLGSQSFLENDNFQSELGKLAPYPNEEILQTEDASQKYDGMREQSKESEQTADILDTTQGSWSIKENLKHPTYSDVIGQDSEVFSDETNLQNLDHAELTAMESNIMETVIIDQEVPQNTWSKDIYATEEFTRDSKPNIIEPLQIPESNNFQDLQHLHLYQRRVRDTLVLHSISEDFSFNWASGDALEWLQFRHNQQELLLGKLTHGLLIVNPNGSPQMPPVKMDFDFPITALETFSFWNFDLYQEEGVIIVGSMDTIYWYRHKRDTQQFSLFGKWDLGGYITQMSQFRKGTEDRLVVGFNHTMLQVFKFHLDQQQYWMTQELFMQQGFQEFVIVKTASDTILALSHEHVVSIYSKNSESSKDFQLQQSIIAPEVAGMCTFSVGGESYLALTGQEAKILKFSQHKFQEVAFLSGKFGKVESILPMPLKSQQEDLLLLLQFSNNSQSSVQTVLWNGKSFEAGLPVPCYRKSNIARNLDCLLDKSTKNGAKIFQGSCLFSSLDTIFLIIPALGGHHSQVFRFHFELLPENSELLDLFEYFVILKSWFEKQHQIVTQAQEFLKTPDEVLLQKVLEQQTSTLDYVETPELQFAGEVSEIYLNDHLWSKEDSEINLDSLINLIEDLDNNLSSSRQRRELGDSPEMVYDHLSYDTMVVEELEIENLNGEKFFVNEGVLDFAGEIEVDNLKLLKENGDGVTKRQSMQGITVLEGDLQFDVINGIKWSELKENIVFRNEAQELEALNVEGQIIVEQDLSIKSLNTLNFPEDYLVANGPRSSIVRAEKHFLNDLTANSVDTEGLINGQNPLEAITLMDQQEWQGFPVFNHLEVSEKLELHGTAHGRNVQSTPTNPTLQEAQVIDASCIFNDLTVHGPIVLKGDFDQQPLAEILNGVVQRPDNPTEEIEVSSGKTFEEVTFPIDFVLLNNTINGIPTDNFVTAHTDQTLSINSLDGYVYFYNLTLKGLYDDINIEDVLKEIIILDKPLDLSSLQLIFEDQPVQAENFIVLEQLNGVDIKTQLQSLQEDLLLDSAQFQDIQAQVAEFSGDILGPGKLNNIELEAFVSDRSWHEPPVQGNLFIKELSVERGLQTDEIYGIDAEDLLQFLQKIDELPEMVLNGQIQVDHITVMGDVQLHKVNGLQFDEDLQMTTIWLNRQNYLTNNLTFRDLVEVKGNLRITGNYQNQNLNALLNDFVLKDSNTSTIRITSPKSFVKPVDILQNFQVAAINGRHLENLAFKTRENIFRGSLKIQGNLFTPDLEVQDIAEYVNLKDFDKFLYFDPGVLNFVLKDVRFEQPLNLHDLTVGGDFNDLPNMEEFFATLVHKDQPSELKGNYTFTGRVSIDQGLHVQHLNGIDVAELLRNVVLLQEVDTNMVTSPLHFQDPVKFEQIKILKTLETHELNGCSLAEWLNDTLRVDQDQNVPHYLRFPEGSLDGNALKVRFINDLDMTRIITLNTPQVFEESVRFLEVILRGSMQANGSINGLNLEEEYNNTLMIYGGQRVTTPLITQSIEVLGDLEIRCLVNNAKDLNDVATLHGNLNLQSPVYFKSLYSPQFITKDLVTGIDLNKWFETSLRAQGKDTQYVTGNWTTGWLEVKSGSNDFQYDTNNFQPMEYDSFIRSLRSSESDQSKMCEILKDIWKKLKQKTVQIKYIEEDFGIDPVAINSQAKRRKLFQLTAGEDVILVLNLDCLTHLYKWLPSKSQFIPLTSYESGYIDQITMLPSNNSTSFKFVTNYESTEAMNCSVKGLNLWSLSPNATSHERAFLENITDLCKPSSPESSLFLMTENAVKELNLSSYHIKDKWLIPSNSNEQTKPSYRFLVNADSEDIAVTNGRETVVLTNRKLTKTKKEVDSNPYTSPLQPWPPITILHELSPCSLLKPNSTMTREFIFSDFQQTLQRLIQDVIEKLNHQVNITQLTIPESDLYDEHLIPDFLKAMDRLRKQKIFTQQELPLHFSNLTIPQNPAHVLATRVVLAVWPKIEELQEIHGFLKSNHSHNHPVCKNVTQTLGALIAQVLNKAYPKDSNDTNQNLIEVIEVIHICQTNLQRILAQIKNVTKVTRDPLFATQGDLMATASQQKLKLTSSTPQTSQGIPKPELLSLQVGSVKDSHRLLATTKVSSTLTPGFDSTIHLHKEDLKGPPYQIIAAHKPRSLIQLRLGAETLLGYIENCCHVEVWRYQGVQGFVKFAHFESDLPIDQLLMLSVPEEGVGSKHFLALLLSDSIKFYEFVLEGTLYHPPDLPCP